MTNRLREIETLGQSIWIDNLNGDKYRTGKVVPKGLPGEQAMDAYRQVVEFVKGHEAVDFDVEHEEPYQKGAALSDDETRRRARHVLTENQRVLDAADVADGCEPAERRQRLAEAIEAVVRVERQLEAVAARITNRLATLDVVILQRALELGAAIAVSLRTKSAARRTD